MRQVKIVLVDDHPLVRLGVRLQLSTCSDLQVCGEGDSNSDTLKLVEQHQPDLLILDIALKDGLAVQAVKQVKSRYPDVRVLVLSGFEESLYGERVLRAGASGYLNKQEAASELLKAVRTVLQGNRYVSADLSRRLIARALGNVKSVQDPVELLTDRELEVFQFIGQGMTSSLIASRLHLSPHTIDSHRENIKRKLGAKDGAELNRKAVQWVLENR